MLRLSATQTIPVLHVINGEHYSGAERVQDLLAGRLPELGFDADLACIKPGRFAEFYQSRTAEVHAAPMRSRFDLRPVRRLTQLVRDHGYQLLHAHTPRTAMVAAVASKISGVPLVYHVHSPTDRDSTRAWQNRVNTWIERAALHRASALIAVSESLGRWARRRASRGTAVAVVPNGVPARPVRPPRSADQPAWTLGAMALFRPRKGIEVLLEALARLRRQGLPVRLRAVGDFESDEYRREILRWADAMELREAIDWVGFARNVDGELAQMDVFVLPSLFGEGLPMVVLEAMAAGVPVVAAAVEGVPEAIRDGQDGLLAAPGDAAALAEAIAQLVRGQCDWQALRASALDRHAAQFSDAAMAAGVAEVYRRVLGI